MTPKEYTKLALRTERTPLFVNAVEDQLIPDLKMSRIMHALLGLCTEVGELQDVVKKHVVYGKPLDITHLIEEAGDIEWYLALLLDACDSSIEEAMEKNISKLEARYGGKFSSERALVRDLDAERKALEALPPEATGFPRENIP